MRHGFLFFLLVLLGTGCGDNGVSGEWHQNRKEKMQVPLFIDFADDADGYALTSSPNTKSGTIPGKKEISCTLSPSLKTKSSSLKPDRLYNLEIQQYDLSGNRIGGMESAVSQSTGSQLTVSLSESADCQLVIVAWGEGNSIRLGEANLANAQKNAVFAASAINVLDPEVQADMNRMPYVLHLKHIKVTGNGTTGFISSIDDKDQDIRIRLQRLAVRLNLNWSYTYSGYQVNQILLQSIPSNYNVIADPDVSDQTYPSLLDQFTTFKLEDSDLLAGTYSCWLPANVRGESALATSPVYRTKQVAPIGSSYISMIAGNISDPKKKLDYRIYLGGAESTDFNLYANTDYTYTIRINHTGLPVNDKRVTIIDPVPASENNKNLVPTANCFMVIPGGSFCFNPYTFYKNGGEDVNDLLQNWCTSTPVKSVKVLWQTKENGDVGDPVLGVVNSSDDHTNIVSLKNGESFTDARIYCRVASNTTGGSGLIVAYDNPDGTGNILWSWHIWVTDYNPDARGNATVLTPGSKRKQKYEGNSAPDQYPLMDRNLGAMAGYDVAPGIPLDQSKGNGYHYQQGRKDPFPSSYSAEAKSQINNIYSTTPPKGMLNLYGPDGITYRPRERGTMSSIREACRHPVKMYTSSSFSESQGTGWSGSIKTVHDPCPAGWRVAAKENFRALFNGSYLVDDGNVQKKDARLAPGFSWSDGEKYGGYLVVFDSNSNTTYLRMTGFGNNSNSFVIVGQAGNIWTRDHKYTFDFGFNANASGKSAYEVSTGWLCSDAHAVRCIQELP